MLPRWHIFWGAILTLVIWWIYPQTLMFYLALVFLASFLIDFDHYMASVIRSGKILSLSESFRYHRLNGKIGREERDRGIRRKGDFHLFHTVEFHILVGALGLWWVGFFYIFIGMVFHSLLDIMTLTQRDYLYIREFFLSKWIIRKLDKAN